MFVQTHWQTLQKIGVCIGWVVPNPGWFILSIFCLRSICAFCTSSGLIKNNQLAEFGRTLSVKKDLVINHDVASVSFISFNKLHMTPFGFQPVANMDSWSITEGYFIWKNTAQWCSCLTDCSRNFWDISVTDTTAVFHLRIHIIRKILSYLICWPLLSLLVLASL